MKLFNMNSKDLDIEVYKEENGYEIKLESDKIQKMFIPFEILNETNMPKSEYREILDRVLALLRTYHSKESSYSDMFKDFYFKCPNCSTNLNAVVMASIIGTLTTDQNGLSRSKYDYIVGNVYDFISNEDSVFGFECEKCRKESAPEIFNTIPYTNEHETFHFETPDMINSMLITGLLTHSQVKEEIVIEDVPKLTPEQAAQFLKTNYPRITQEEIDKVLQDVYDVEYTK